MSADPIAGDDERPGGAPEGNCSMKPASQLLREAARHVEAFGLLKGNFGTASGPCCALGALTLADGGDPFPGVDDDDNHVFRGDLGVAVLSLAAHIKPAGFWPEAPADVVIEWNDDETRTTSDVAAAMRAAAEGCV